MNISIRRPVHFDSFGRWLSGLEGIPVELALPHDMEEFFPSIDRLPELAEYVRGKGIVVHTVHAPQGRLSGNTFLSWSALVIRFSESVGASSVVFHPETVRKADRQGCHEIALDNIRALQRQTGLDVAIETFRSSNRVIRTDEIVKCRLPMVLDTSHLFQQHTFDVIRQYSRGIVAVHLSENRMDPNFGKPSNHMPVEEFGISVLETLRKAGWEGNITLEYLQHYHDRLIPDRERLESMFGGQGRAPHP